MGTQRCRVNSAKRLLRASLSWCVLYNDDRILRRFFVYSLFFIFLTSFVLFFVQNLLGYLVEWELLWVSWNTELSLEIHQTLLTFRLDPKIELATQALDLVEIFQVQQRDDVLTPEITVQNKGFISVLRFRFDYICLNLIVVLLALPVEIGPLVLIIRASLCIVLDIFYRLLISLNLPFRHLIFLTYP